jgi:hypothetical protein
MTVSTSRQTAPATTPRVRRLAGHHADRRYRDTLDAGGDPALIAGWITETTAIKKTAQARLGLTEAPPQRMTGDQLDAIADAFNDLFGPLREADPRSLHNLPHRPDGDPRGDSDLAGGGIIKVFEDRTGDTYPGLPCEPKGAFTVMAEHHAYCCKITDMPVVHRPPSGTVRWTQTDRTIGEGHARSARHADNY